MSNEPQTSLKDKIMDAVMDWDNALRHDGASMSVEDHLDIVPKLKASIKQAAATTKKVAAPNFDMLDDLEEIIIRTNDLERIKNLCCCVIDAHAAAAAGDHDKFNDAACEIKAQRMYTEKNCDPLDPNRKSYDAILYAAAHTGQNYGNTLVEAFRGQQHLKYVTILLSKTEPKKALAPNTSTYEP